MRISFNGKLGNARINMQIDIGFGDIVSPAPLWVEYPVLLEGERPKLLAYKFESAIAEKFEAMVILDMTNSRMKDFFDIWYLSGSKTFSGRSLASAVNNTFRRRKTELPKRKPVAFTKAFYDDKNKITQWKSFQQKIDVQNRPEELEKVVEDISKYLWPVTESLNHGKEFSKNWNPETGWR